MNSCLPNEFYDPKIQKCNYKMFNTKGKYGVIVFFILYFILINVIFFGVQTHRNTLFMGGVDGAERQENGHTLGISGSFAGAVFGNTPFITDNSKLDDIDFYNEMIMIDQNGEIVWSFDEVKVDHVAKLRGDTIFVSNNHNDSIIAVSYPEGEIIWRYNFQLLNFTKINSEWGSDHYYNTPEVSDDWTHINDIDFRNYGTWNSCMIDLRNFDLIIEINFTSAYQKSTPDPNDVTWWYNEETERQHNPDYLPNGNIIVSNSDGKNFFEINYTTKELEWIWTHPTIDWARDIDLMPNGNYLITDIDEVIEVDIENNQIVKQWVKSKFGLYESDYLENGNVLVSGGINGRFFEINPEGKIVWEYGGDNPTNTAILYGSFFILLEMYFILSALTNKRIPNKYTKYIIGSMGLLLFGNILSIIFIDEIFTTIMMNIKF